MSYIPCLYIPYKIKSLRRAFTSLQENESNKQSAHKILLYFHGNAEDIGHSYDFLKNLGQKFHV